MRPMRIVSPVLLSLWIAALVCGASPAVAAPGDFDPSFDGDGIVRTDFGSDAAFLGVAIQPDGKILASGWRATAPTFIVARYDVGGSPDPGFGTGGVAAADFGIGGEFAGPLVVAPDGTIVVAGVVAAPGAGSQVAIARFDVNGALDPSFGTGGMTVTDVAAGTNDTVNALVRLPSGRLVIGGSTTVAGTPHGLLVAFDDAGAVDTAFGSSGIVVTADPEQIRGLAVNGSVIVAAGTVGMDLALARFTVAGAPIGVAHVSLASATAVTIDANGRALVAGSKNGLTAVVRFDKSGKLDAKFGNGGITQVDLPANNVFDFGDEAQALTIQPDGKILFASVVNSASAPPFSLTYQDWWLGRFDAHGTLDAGFADGGLLDVGGGEPRSLALQPDGKVVTAGYDRVYTSFYPLETSSDAVLTRNEAVELACAASALPSCAPAGAAAAALTLSEVPGKAPKLVWKWKKGSATLAQLGNPTTDGPYAFCAYDATGALVLGADVDAGGVCAGKPCWKAAGASGWQYKDSEGTQWGIDQIKLKAGTGAAQISVQGKHANLPHLALPASLPLRVQLQAPTGSCFEAVFSTSTANDATHLKAKSD